MFNNSGSKRGLFSPVASRKGYVVAETVEEGEEYEDKERDPDEWSPLNDKRHRQQHSSSSHQRTNSSLALVMGSPMITNLSQSIKKKGGGCPAFLLLALLFGIPLAFVVIAGAYSTHTHQLRPLEALEWRKSEACGVCNSSPASCQKYGAENLNIARAYRGSGRRLREVLRRARAGKPIKTAVIGGSVSEGVGVAENMRWHEQVANWFNTSFPNAPAVEHVVGAVPGRGSDYFLTCHKEHIDTDVDIVLIELGINDYARNDRFFRTMEALVRSVLSFPNRPAIMFAESFTIALDQLSTGTDSHFGIANYYDIPTISLRDWLLPSLLADPSLKDVYFFGDRDGTGEHMDYLHISPVVHTALADQLKAILDQELCLVKNDLGNDVSTASYPWPDQTKLSIDPIPRLRLTDKWSDTGSVPPPIAACRTLDTKKPESRLKQLPSSTGWVEWKDVNAWRGEKTYLRAKGVGARVDFEIETVFGTWSLYYLRSPKKSLGNVWCWVDDEKTKGLLIEGYWSLGINLPMQEGLSRGKHQIHCEVVESTLDPNDGHEFLIIALVSA